MEFDNIDQLRDIFTGGEFTFPESFILDGIKYNTNSVPVCKLDEMHKKGYKAPWFYATPFKEQAKEKNMLPLIMFLWGFVAGGGSLIRPYDVRFSTRATSASNIVEMTGNDGNMVTIPKEKVLGDVVDILITNLPGTKPIRGKIDTGADVSSFHADEWKITNGQVTFTSPDLSENAITMPVIEKQAIKLSNGDVEYRPVVEFNIKINDQQLSNCMFNLNDRGSMQYSILIGQNVLEAGGFFINPSINDNEAPTVEGLEIDLEGLQEELKDDVVTNPVDILDKIKGLLADHTS